MLFIAPWDIGLELELGQGNPVKSLFVGPEGFSLGYFISRILPNIYVIAGVILFFLLIGGGLMFIISSGQQNPEGASKGMQAVTAALLGFLIIFASYWIMQIIQFITGINLGFNLGL